MADGLALDQRARAVEREELPALALARPVERRLPALRRARVPAVRQPVLRAPVAAGADELEILAARDGRARELERLEQASVSRPLVVEGEFQPQLWLVELAVTATVTGMVVEISYNTNWESAID